VRRNEAWRYVPLGIWLVFVAMPLYWVVVTAFKDNTGIYGGASWIPWVDFTPTTQAWHEIFGGSSSVVAPLEHSLIISTVATTVSVFAGSLAGYGLARFRVKLGFMKNDDVAFFVVSQRIMPPVVIVLAFFLAYKYLHLLDSLLGMMIIYTAFSIPLATWFMQSYFKQIPTEIEEAAYIDGDTRLTAFLRVALPLTLPGLIATFLLTFSFVWNEFLYAVILTSNRATTLPIVIAVQQGEQGTSWWNICAISLISIAPMVVVAAFLQKHLVTGLLGGALK
jgi:multiple sugar transport system permease protein